MGFIDAYQQQLSDIKLSALCVVKWRVVKFKDVYDWKAMIGSASIVRVDIMSVLNFIASANILG